MSQLCARMEEAQLAFWGNGFIGELPGEATRFPYMPVPVLAILAVDGADIYNEAHILLNHHLIRAGMRTALISANGYSALFGADWQLPWTHLEHVGLKTVVPFLATRIERICADSMPEVITVGLPSDGVLAQIDQGRAMLETYAGTSLASTALGVFRPDGFVLCCRFGTSPERLGYAKDVLTARGMTCFAIVVDPGWYLDPRVFTSAAGTVSPSEMRDYLTVLSAATEVPSYCIDDHAWLDHVVATISAVTKPRPTG